MSNKFNVCPTCLVSWYADEPPKHMMTCTGASRDRRAEHGFHIKGKKMNSLERLKEAAEHPGSYINGPDIALALKVVEAASDAAGSIGDSHISRELYAALAALTEEKP